MVEVTEKKPFENRKDWRKWLEMNHEAKKEIWLILYKKHTKKKTIRLNEAVEEALCFGWIDGIIKRMDENRYVVRFTQRNPHSIWSEININRVKKLIEQGKMTKIGLEKTKNMNSAENRLLKQKNLKVPGYITESLKFDNIAYKNFQNLAPSLKKQYVWWIESAKKQDTREKRIKEGRKRLSEGRKPGIYWY